MWEELKKWIKEQNQYIQSSGLYHWRDKVTIAIWTRKILDEMEELESYEEVL